MWFNVASPGNVFALSLILHQTNALQNGFGRTPIMGFNTYNAYSCTINQTVVTQAINDFSSGGFQSLGYRYFQLDCGWQGTQRQSNGSITYDASEFPEGMSALSKYAISKGFQWSLYTDEGVQACDYTYRPGSSGYEQQDAAQLAGWNVAYMKVDNCYANSTSGDAPHDPRTDFVSRYTPMSQALTKYGIKGMLVCQWGVPWIDSQNNLEGPAQWTPQLSTSFRVSDDIANGYTHVQRIMNEAINVNLRGLSGPGNFADMDLLEVGNNGMTTYEEQTHFALWAMFKSALMVSTPINQLSPASKATLQNKGLIAINQDSLGKPVVLRQRYTNDNDQFYGKLSNGDVAVLLIDQSNTARSLTLNLNQYNISTATVTDLWSGQVVSNTASYTVSVQPHGNMAVRLSNIVYASSSTPKINYYNAGSGSYSGGARSESCSGCGSGQKASYVGSGGSVTISGISTSASSQNVLFDYINCDIGYLGTTNAYSNQRGASISVNGGAATNVLFPISGYNWDADVLRSFNVLLSGFNAGSSNNYITISGWSGTTQYAPDFDRVGVLA